MEDPTAQELDTILEKLMGLVDEYTALRERCSKYLGAGFLNLAQAKYAIGPSRLTQYQYDNRMQATTIITPTENEKGEPAMLLNRLKQSIAPDPSDSSNPDDSKNIRQRGNRTKSRAEQDEGTEAKESNTTSTKDQSSNGGANKATAKDPLNWFGVLVPTHLRSAQAEFNQGGT
ncbi:hypothetical protein HDV00_006290 [Rhizophlyctis rosea]|nr:hypothetical protein HDV00_006290 [Rhizophlyctis rosea]